MQQEIDYSLNVTQGIEHCKKLLLELSNIIAKLTVLIHGGATLGSLPKILSLFSDLKNISTELQSVYPEISNLDRENSIELLLEVNKLLQKAISAITGVKIPVKGN